MNGMGANTRPWVQVPNRMDVPTMSFAADSEIHLGTGFTGYDSRTDVLRATGDVDFMTAVQIDSAADSR